MPDDLYDRDTLARSEHEPNLLRRVARGERVNEVDWEHVIEEIEDVGLSQRNAVQSYAECWSACSRSIVRQRTRRPVTGEVKTSYFRRTPQSGSLH